MGSYDSRLNGKLPKIDLAGIALKYYIPDRHLLAFFIHRRLSEKNSIQKKLDRFKRYRRNNTRNTLFCNLTALFLVSIPCRTVLAYDMHTTIYKKKTARQVSLGLYNATDSFSFFPVRFTGFIPKATRKS